MPAGFRYARDLLTPDEERYIIAAIQTLPLVPFQFRGYEANRRVAAFGFRYDFGEQRVHVAAPWPDFLENLRERIAAFAGRAPEDFRQAMVTEYTPGTAIGWHRDRPQFGDVVGVSLASAAPLRFRRRAGDRWQRATHIVEPRSAYLMSGEIRREWEHSLAPLAALRYSLTFRTLASDFTPPAPRQDSQREC